MRVQRTDLLDFNIRRGQMPGVDRDTYIKLQNNVVCEVSDEAGQWLIEHGYATETQGD